MVSLLRMRALIESAAFIARPTARALGIFECARMLSFWRSVSVSRFTVWLDLSALPQAATRQIGTTHRMDFMAGNFTEPAYTCNPTWLLGDQMHRLSLVVVLLVVTACRPSLAHRLSEGKWVDLTYDFDSTTIYWPTAQPFRLTVVSAQRMSGGYYYAANNFAAAEHGGTHLDAPVHFAEGKHTTDQIPVVQLVGPAYVIDVSRQAEAERDYRIASGDLEGWEQAHGRIPEGAIVLFRTGWGSRWPDRARYLGTTKAGAAAVPELHFPGIHPDAARWLVERKVRAVGIDTPSIDYGQSTTFDTHRTLFAADIPAFENVAHLSAVPATGAFVIGLPMKIRGGSGGPLRVVAGVPPGGWAAK